jgi:hypothetical protein
MRVFRSVGLMASVSLAGMSLDFLKTLTAVVPTAPAPWFNARSNAKRARPRKLGTSQRKHEGIDLRPMAEAKRQRKRAKRLRDRRA